MTAETLIQQLENYYGEYQNQKLKSFVLAYIKKDHDQKRLDDLLKSILYYHRANFNAPCIASIEECIKQARSEKGLNNFTAKPTDTKKWQDDRGELTEEEVKKNLEILKTLKSTIKRA